MSSTSGVYEIFCIPTGRRYVGSTLDFKKRTAFHRWQLGRGDHHSRALQRAWINYGAEAFEFRMMLVCAPKDLLFYEQRVIDGLRPAFNMLPTAGSVLGLKWSAQSRERHRETWKQKVAPQLDHAAHGQKVQAAWKSGAYAASMRAKSNLYPHGDRTYTVAEAAAEFGINKNTLKYRLAGGMPFAEAIFRTVLPTYNPRG